MEYKNVGNHAEDLADGRMIAPGETVELDEDQVREDHNEDLLARGALIGIDEKGEHEAKLASNRVKRQEAKTQAQGEEA
jgi:hypothetical protein